MKKNNDYRADGFRTWRMHIMDSAIVSLMQIIGIFIYACLTTIILIRFPGNETKDLLWKFGKTLLMLCTVGLLSYYVPVWFMQVRRNQSLIHSDLSTGYGRALLVSAAVIAPTLVSDIWGILVSLGAMDTLGKHGGSVLMALLLFAVIWPYAVGITLPFRAFEHPDIQVHFLTRTSWKMMDGYKWKLFCIDFKIWVWPVVIVAISAFICLVVWLIPIEEALKMRNMTFDMFMDEDYVREPVMRYAWAKHAGMYIISSLVMIIELAVCFFIILPANHFAHICFYEDLLAERNGDIVNGEANQGANQGQQRPLP